MNLRFNALLYPVIRNFVKKLLVFVLLACYCPVAAQSTSDEDLKKQADKYFEEEDYSKAYKLYSQLVSNFPKDPEYNYKLGVCMIYSEPNKKKALPYLKFATANAQGNKNLKDVKFYLGKAYHINYLFDDAIKTYNDYKLTASASQIKKLEVDREIKACGNGKRLLSSLTDLEVLSKTELPENDYFRNYKKIGGKLLVKPEEFQTSTDKKKKEKSVVFLPTGSNVIYFSSYGDNPQTGKDLYTTFKQADGSYGKPEKVKGLNTEFDDDYPFLHPDGKTLYFASKGHNSMGGYDIFKSIFDESSNAWGPPTNLEFPINSPDDDYLFVTDSLETMAYFSTGRQSPPGKVDVLKVKTSRRPIDIIALKGNVIQGSPEYNLNSTISVKDVFSQNEIGSFSAEEDGSYEMEVPNGSKLIFTVETPGQETQSVQVSMPMASVSKPYKQTISYEKGKLKILNYFDEAATDNTYLQYLNVIEKKAKLDVNESTSTTPPIAATTTNPSPEPAKIENNSGSEPKVSSPANTTPGLDNKQLAELARQDAEQSLQQASQLARDYTAANETAKKQKAEADKKISEAAEAMAKAESITNEDEKKIAIDNATVLKQSAEKDLLIANRIADLAKSLDEDARNKKKEASLNSEYAKELEKSLKTKDNKTSVGKMEELQKEIDVLAQQKAVSDKVINEIKTDVEQKEKQIASAEEINNNVKSNLEEIKTAISDKETELAKTKKKSAKQLLNKEIEDLKTEQAEKETQIATNTAELITMTDDLTYLKNELEIVNEIKSDIVVSKPASSPAAVAEVITAKTLADKYKESTVITNPTDVSSIEQSTAQLTNYNNELDQLIAKNKSEAAKTKNKDSKLKFNNENKTLEARKKQNQQAIAANTKSISNLAVSPVKTEGAKSTYDPIVANTPADAVTKLDNLNIQLIGNDNENFDFNGYQNPQAQSLKVEADAKINDALAKQKKLKDEIATSKEQLQNTATTPVPGISTEDLNKQAEELQLSAQKKRQQAQSKTGPEKDKLIEESKTLEEQANSKLIEAAEVTRNDNSKIISANRENIEILLAENKSGAEDQELARALNEEAKTALKKADDIRTEGNSLTNAGGKLGSFSNAEEKENEAMMKQKQAVDLLMKSNPGFALKTPASNVVSEPGQDVNAKLQTVNAGLADLATIKVESYQKLFDANQAEIDQLQSDIKDNQSAIDNTPSLKTEYLAANKKIEAANTLKQNSDNAANSNEKLSSLISSIKKQTEGIKQLNSVSTSIGQVVVSDKLNTTVSPKTPVNADMELPLNPIEPPVNVEQPAKPVDDLGMLSEIDTGKNEEDLLAKNDTTPEQVLNYLNTKSSTIRNSQANELVKNSMNQLKDFESQEAALNKNELPTGTPAELNTKSDELLTEAERISARSVELKKEAETKTGEDKNYLLAQARELEIEGQDKTLLASEYRQQANDAEYKNNDEAISELTEKLKVENPTLASEMEAKKEEFAPLKTQVNNLRTEANALNSKAAKIGALSNAEEKDLELMQKQTALLNDLKKQYPDFAMKPVIELSPEAKAAQLDAKKSQLREKQYSELTNLTNAFSLEYESSKNALPANLSSEQRATKQSADNLNAESKRLLIKASQEKNQNEKIKLLTLAVKSGNTAVDKLNKLLPKQSAQNELSAISNESINTDEPAQRNTRVSKKSVSIDGLDVLENNAYSSANPIPFDLPMESGLVFRVQIGAFKVKLPNNAFKGLSPLNGETTSNGYFRYTAGNFNKIENANAVKNDLRNLGYSDAFVVVYYNGKRITLGEAIAQMEKDGQSVDPNAPQTAGITVNANVPKATANPAIQESVIITKELGKIEGMLLTVQIGVYTKQVTKSQLLNLRPIFREELKNGLYRYTAGIYNNPEKIVGEKNKVVDMGIKDAFVSAYVDGKRISFVEAKEKMASGAQLKMESENPIVFPERAAVPTSNPFEEIFNAATNVEPFKNSVSNYPTPTSENGVKNDEQGVTYKVQIGAFSKQVPADVAAKFSSIKTWPVDNKKINGLYIYNIGNFSEVKFAKELKDESVRLGITDAFITVYRDGKKIYGPEAEALLR